ncbi:ISAs1 family transposase, partial [Marichromatium bheemlicum]
ALLELLQLEGCIVTIDAMGCQHAIAERIQAQGADYVLALKGNQPRLAEAVEEAFIDADACDYADTDSQLFETRERGHGRSETRRYRTLAVPADLPGAQDWPGLRTLGMVESERTVNDQVSREIRFFISSLDANAETFARAVRDHWGIENTL